MERITQTTRTPYFFTDKQSKLPQMLIQEFKSTLSIDFNKEKFIAACWIDQSLPKWVNFFFPFKKPDFLSPKRNVFAVVTERRIAFRIGHLVRQNMFKDLTGVERDIFKNIILLSPGNRTCLFPALEYSLVGVPADKLSQTMFDIINDTWVQTVNKKEVKSENENVESTSSNHDVISQIERLNELKNKGIVSEEEFKAKKTELLSRM